MNTSLTLIVFIVNVVLTLTFQTAHNGYQHRATLDQKGHFLLWWNYDEDKITFLMSAKTTGWIGIGISPNGGMKGADMAIGWVTQDGQSYLLDTYGEGNFAPNNDKSQDLTLIESWEEDGWTSIEFSRKLNSCDALHDHEITGDTLQVLYAYGEKDPIKNKELSGGDYHYRTRGVRSLIFLQNAGTLDKVLPNSLSDSEDIKYKQMDFLNDNFEMPEEQTYYNCKSFKIPPLPKTHHVVKFEAVIQEGNEMHVHHILLYQCFAPLISKALGEDHRCYRYTMWQDFGNCKKILVAWAIGASDVVLPLHVGFPIGESNEPTYLLMETHYDDPDMKSFVDSSGFRIHYTDKLRQYDADFLTVGHQVTELQVIPPKQTEYKVFADCPHQCLDWGMDKESVEEINILGSVLHSHTAGRGLELKHLRNGMELPPISKDDFYDFNYQELRRNTPEIKFKKGDSLKMICNYNTKDRKNITLGGLGTREEMCLAFIMYYPKIPVAMCESEPKVPGFVQHFGLDVNFGRSFLDMKAHTVVKNDNKWNLEEYLNNVEWTAKDAEKISKLEEDTDLNVLCLGKGIQVKKIKDARSQKITSPYKKKNTCSDAPKSSSSLTKSSLIMVLFVNIFVYLTLN